MARRDVSAVITSKVATALEHRSGHEPHRPTHVDLAVQSVLYQTVAGVGCVLGVLRGVSAILAAVRERLDKPGLTKHPVTSDRGPSSPPRPEREGDIVVREPALRRMYDDADGARHDERSSIPNDALYSRTSSVVRSSSSNRAVVVRAAAAPPQKFWRYLTILELCTILSDNAVSTVPPPQNCSIETPAALNAPVIHVATLVTPELREMRNVWFEYLNCAAGRDPHFQYQFHMHSSAPLKPLALRGADGAGSGGLYGEDFWFRVLKMKIEFIAKLANQLPSDSTIFSLDVDVIVFRPLSEALP